MDGCYYTITGYYYYTIRGYYYTIGGYYYYIIGGYYCYIIGGCYYQVCLSTNSLYPISSSSLVSLIRIYSPSFYFNN